MKHLPLSLHRTLVLAFLLVVGTILTIAAVLIPLIRNTMTLTVREGEIARRDYRAPFAITFTSDVLTKQLRDSAERAVSPIYTSPDTRVARRQLEQLRAILAFINSVRADTFATTDQKFEDLSAIEDINLRSDTIEAILNMPDARWQEIQQETIAVLERAMSSPIRTENLRDVRNRLPAMVTLSLPEEQGAIVAEFASAFVVPNSSYSEDLTLAAREAARDSISPVVRTYITGQTIALQGEILAGEDIEALQQFGLVEPEQTTQDIASAVIFSLLMVAIIILYTRRKQSLSHASIKTLTVLGGLLLGFLIFARLIIPNSPLLQFGFPLAAAAMVTASLFGAEIALVTIVPLSLLVAYGLPGSLEISVFYLVSSLFGVLILGRARRMISFFWAGLAAAISGAAVIVIFRLPLPNSNFQELAALSLAAFFNGLISASFSILLHSLLAPVLGMLTPWQLFDLTRPDHPLLAQILRDTPGTYQHSLQVANLAEQAAERIGVDPMLIRVGALYHDVGKVSNPAFFIENQPPGFKNPHDNLSPQESARIIITHVNEGLKLARRHHLPRAIWGFIDEHHGTTITNYQYFNAVKAAGGEEFLVDKAPFRYPGPKPQSRETAILMLADACEARVRAERPSDDETLRSLIKNVVSNRLSGGQLDDTRLTMRDLNEIVESFTATLRGVYHPRIHYPNQDTVTESPQTEQPITIPIPKNPGIPVDIKSTR